MPILVSVKMLLDVVFSGCVISNLNAILGMIVKDNSVSYDSPYEVRGDPRRLALVRLHFPYQSVCLLMLMSRAVRVSYRWCYYSSCPFLNILLPMQQSSVGNLAG